MEKTNKKVRALTITYEVDGGLYINLTNRCSNSCEFCIRNNGDGAYGSDSLWLSHEPTVEEIKEDIGKRDIGKYSEIVFCGYGEPTYRLDVAREIALYVKSLRADIRVRMNTNGQADIILGRETASEFEGAFDCVSISLNTPSAEKYNEICHPVYKERAYFAMLDFAEKVKKYVPDVQLSVVRQTLSEDELALCGKIADERGVKLRIRDYIS